MPGPLPPRLSIAQCAAACLAATLCLFPGGAARAGPTSDCVTPENSPGIAIADKCIPFDQTHLTLMDAAVPDLSPLAGLTALEELYIYRTPVSDLSPLAGLTALESLEINKTQVTDLSPLSGLTNLWKLQAPDGTQHSTRPEVQDAIAAASP
jgi:hypothetical protein